MIASYELPWLLTVALGFLILAAAFLIAALARMAWRYTENQYARRNGANR